MVQTRVIPCLLLRNLGLVKTRRFKDPVYVGDPINAVRIFNDKEVDELVFLDITATVEGKRPPFELLAKVASQCFMPLCYGGGVRSLEDMAQLYEIGIEKVALNTQAVRDPALVRAASARFGAQSVIVSIDVKKSFFGKYEVVIEGGRRRTGIDPVCFAADMEAHGAGELLLNSVDRDGMMEGYDLELIRRVTVAVGIPVVACGGAGKTADLAAAVAKGGASAAAAGSLFVFQGPRRAVMINYPTPHELAELFTNTR
jgi:cyclase